MNPIKFNRNPIKLTGISLILRPIHDLEQVVQVTSVRALARAIAEWLELRELSWLELTKLIQVIKSIAFRQISEIE